MKLNCKPGDLAVIVRSDAGNEGRIVRCIRFVGKVPGWVDDDRWEIDQVLKGHLGGKSKTVRDSRIRPLRDPGEDARDESLSWLPVPSREEVSV